MVKGALVLMGTTAMGRVGDGASTRWDATAMEHDGWGLAAMGATAMGRDGWGLAAMGATAKGALVSMGTTAMGRVGNGASARWGATAGAWRQWARWQRERLS